MKLINPAELYEAAKTTCQRLYIANGGNPSHEWHVEPYPGTAAIAFKPALHSGECARWILAMPAFPAGVLLPRWKSELIAAYTVHELLHALWTDWGAVRYAKGEGLARLLNALEDNRIEAKASRGALSHVSEARRLLETLNDHIAARAMRGATFDLDDSAQFSFILNLAIFMEKLGYQTAHFPRDWRAHIRPEWLPLFDHALARFNTLQTTGDALTLARELQTMAKAVRTPARVVQPGNVPVASREAEIVETPDQIAPAPDKSEDAPSHCPQCEGPMKNGKCEDCDAEDAANEPAGGARGEGEDAPGEDTSAPRNTPHENKGEDDGAGSDGAPGDGASEGGARGDGKGVDLSDNEQAYSEANLNDLAEDTMREDGKSQHDTVREASMIASFLNAPRMREEICVGGGDPRRAGAMISSPARLRRHLTMAVKAPERVGRERYQTSGRLDVRNTVGLAIGAANVFKRRVEEEGKEAIVTILLDQSSSMKGEAMDAAKAMAMHMGDALKAAGVKFEIATFDDCHVRTPKPFARGWNNDTRRALAGIKASGGTAMLPAIKQCADRLLGAGVATRRILLCLTDGADSFPEDACGAMVRHYRAKGVEIFGIGLMTYISPRSFNGAHIDVHSCRALSETGLKALVTLLDGGKAPRVRA